MTAIPQQKGVISLLVVSALVMLALLASHYSSQSIFIDRLASRNQLHTTQTQLAAEAALAWAQAQWQQTSSLPDGGSTTWDNATRDACPPGLDLRWQCTRMTPPPAPAMPPAPPPASMQQVTAVRDLLSAPHVIRLLAQASLPAQRSSAQVQESLFVPTVSPAPAQAPAAAVVLNGCLSAQGAAAICPLNNGGPACTGLPTAPAVQALWAPEHIGTSSAASTCLALSPTQLPGGGELRLPTTASPPTRSPCNRAAWRSVLGDITPAQIQAWSTAQERQGLHPQSQPPRSIYWVDSPADWTLSVGQANSPALVVFSKAACASRCPRITPGTHIHGTVVLDSDCQDDKLRGWSAGWIEGQLVVESGLPELASGSQIWARATARQAYLLDWPQGIDATQVQRISGSWRAGAP